MAEEQKNIPLTQETQPETTTAAATTTSTTPAVAAPVVEAPVEVKPVDETPAAIETAAPVVTDDKPTEETKPVEPVEEAAKVDDEKNDEEVKPIEEGYLSHKGQGLSFPKNLIASKEFFWFGSDAVEPKSLSHYLKSEKSADIAHSNIAWASHTGNGLLFVGDKKSPSNIISLADASEPESDGSHKFHLTTNGNKHTFKAANSAERDNWVAQIKAKSAEAKELSASVNESEAYKATIESFKPAPIVKKEDKVAEAPVVEAPKTEETPAVAEEAPVVAEEVKEERKKEEVKSDEPKRRSASRKRTSFFGFGKKEESKKEELKELKKEETAKPADEVAVETPAAEEPKIETPKVETPKIEEPAPVVEAPKPVEEAVKPADEVAVESPAGELESPKEKPTASKRNSFFGSVFSKKEKKTPELKPTEPTDVPKDIEATETAPVIPPVEATTPLAVDVSSPATVPVEATETTAVTATSPAPEAKKDIKEKRKSSLPFAFGKRDKSPAPVEGEKKSESAFSKFRATIKGKSAVKADEKPTEEVKTEEPTKEGETKAEETKPEAVKAEEPAAEPVVETNPENKPENVTAPAPVVTAAA